MTTTEPAPSIIGRERALIDALTKALLDAARRRHDYMKASETRRGAQFLLSLRDPDDEPTGYIVRVSVELLPPDPTAPEVPCGHNYNDPTAPCPTCPPASDA